MQGGIDVNTVIQLLALIVSIGILFMRLSARIDGMRREIIEAMDAKIGKAHERMDQLDGKYDRKTEELSKRINGHGSAMLDMQHSLIVPVIDLVGGLANGAPAAGRRRTSRSS